MSKSSPSQPRDTIFSEPLQQVPDFAFDARVVEVFSDMINRSVPGYQSILHGIGQLAAQFAQPNTHIYDLGCSLGAATLAMRQQLTASLGVKLFAIDNSQPMTERCQNMLNAYRSDIPVQVDCADVRSYPLHQASVVVMNFTLQFVPPAERLPLLQRIYASLAPGGILILSEKFKAETATNDAMLVELHHEFKRANGYSELEIAQKRAAIENVMRIDTLAAHHERLQHIGFEAPQVWFQCYNFCSMMALKPASEKGIS